MGCTDILGISEFRTGARMTYVGVGAAPFRVWERGLGRGWSAAVQREKEQLPQASAGRLV